MEDQSYRLLVEVPIKIKAKLYRLVHINLNLEDSNLRL